MDGYECRFFWRSPDILKIMVCGHTIIVESHNKSNSQIANEFNDKLSKIDGHKIYVEASGDNMAIKNIPVNYNTR